MRNVLPAMFALLLLVVWAGGAFADDMTPTRVVLTADDRVMPASELDEVWPDSIYYHTPNEYQSLYTSNDYWSAVRFTAPANFSLQGVRFLPLNQYDNFDDPCSLFVYSDDDGAPGTALNGGDPIWTGEVPSFSDWIEADIDEADYIDFESGDDFWIMYGPAPGGAYQAGGGWWNLVDASVTQNRSKMNTAGRDEADDWTDVGGDLFITANGEIEQFYDLKIAGVYNDLEMFFVTTDDEIILSAKIKNIGNSDSPDGVECVFTVEDTSMNEAFTETVDVDVIEGGDSLDVSCSVAWTPEEIDKFIVTAELSFPVGEEDPETGNDINYLLQSCVDATDWYAYDDNSFESGSNFSEGNGWATAFRPVSYPAQIDTMAVVFADDDADVNVQLWHFDGAGTITLLWADSSATVVEGWNYFDVSDDDNPNGQNIVNGDAVVMYVWTTGDNSFPKDENEPVSAQNTLMPQVGYQIADGGGSWYLDGSGNWGMRVHMGQGVAPELVFPTTEYDFGEVEIGSVAEVEVEVYNYGTADGHIDSVDIGNNIADWVSVDESFPIAVPPDDENPTTFTVLFAPDEDFEGETLVGGMMVYHDDVSAPMNPVIIQLNATVLSVREIDGAVPQEYFLEQNFPNPFNPTTGITFGVKEAGQVTMRVFNIMGQQVASLIDQPMTVGTHQVTFDASQLSSGIYYYTLEVNGFTDMKKMTLIK